MALGPVASTNSKVASNFGACSPRFSAQRGGRRYLSSSLALCDYGVKRERERERDRMSQREGSRRTRERESISRVGGVRATPSSSFVSAGCRQATY